eukprot:8429639-Alexandrium_andersonii.AAC.1
MRLVRGMPVCAAAIANPTRADPATSARPVLGHCVSLVDSNNCGLARASFVALGAHSRVRARTCLALHICGARAGLPR